MFKHIITVTAAVDAIRKDELAAGSTTGAGITYGINYVEISQINVVGLPAVISYAHDAP